MFSFITMQGANLFYWIDCSCALAGKQSKIKFVILDEGGDSSLVATSP